ncbi:MAG: tetratricopeptide repeat protein [Gammaproteobacteria bacterium]|nr:tetratricopeptide repeat protein [Gammaproteobacteria bacterium]
MRQGFLRGSRYSPGNMDRESLEALFVGRSDDMEDVLSRVTTSIRSPAKHYILLVGPRGSGKTHFLALAYHRLMDRIDAVDAKDSVAVAMLKEEEWGVASFLDLVVRILRALAGQSSDLDGEIAGIYDRFSKDPAGAEIHAAARLRHHTRGKTLLLICENLVDLFHGLGEEGQKRWRSAIQEDGNWAIVASTPSLFSAVTLQDNPFYGFFTIRALEKIDFDTGLDLLARKAVHEDKTDLASFLRTPLGRARARAIHHLAAGNHRAYVVLFDFLDKESLEDLVGPFMHMVDDLTPYYQDRMRQLPPAQRKIVEFLCLQGRPLTIKDISTPCLMSHQTAAKQIGELATAGFISRMRSGRNTFCELSEPLMRICIEVKDNKTRHFRLFVEFLRHWFTNRELERRHAAIQHGVHTTVLDRVHIEAAVRCSLADRHEPFVDALRSEAKRCWDVGDYRGLAEIQETLARDGGSANDYCVWIYALVRWGDGKSAIAAGREAFAKYPDDAAIQYDLAHAYFIEDRFVEALSAIDRAIALNGADSAYLCIRAGILLGLNRFEEAIQDAQAVLDQEPDHWHSFQQMLNAAVAMDRADDAEAYTRELVRLAPDEPEALLAASEFHRSQDRLDQALELVDKALDIDAADQRARHLRGLVLFDMADYRRANEELRQVASHQPNSVSVHCRLSDSLLFSGEWEEAIDVAEHLIEIDPAHFHAHCVRGRALIELGRPADAIAVLDQLLPTDDCHSLLLAASRVRGIGDYASAGRYLDRVAELQPDNRKLWIERTRLHIDEGAFDAAAESAARIEALPGDSLLGPLLAAQAAAATEPLPVALDTLGGVIELGDFENDELLHLKATAGILTVSVRNFGPRYLPEGLAKLQGLLKERLDDGVVGRILTDFLKANIEDGFAGALADWEAALESLTASLADLPDCRIPLEMLQTAVRYTKTGDEKQLLSLPLEQRQLLEDILPANTGEHAGQV